MKAITMRLAALFIALALAIAGTLLVQRPVSFADEGEHTRDHSAHVHQGTCDDFDETVAYSLQDLLIPSSEDGSPSLPSTVGVTSLDISLDDLLAEPYVIDVHLVSDEPEEHFACGEIQGEAATSNMTFALTPHGPHQALSGVAWLRPQGNHTVIAIFIAEGLEEASGMTSSPVAAIDAQEVNVTLGGSAGEFSIESDMTTFQAGVPYRFLVTNAGSIPHEFMVIPKLPAGGMSMDEMHHLALAEIEDSELPPGATATLDIVFPEAAAAGELEFACHVSGHYESGMHIPIEVAP